MNNDVKNNGIAVDNPNNQQTNSNSEIKTVPVAVRNNEPRGSSLDGYLDKVGYNRYHYIMCFVVCYIFFVDGCEMIIMNLLLTTLQKEWQLSSAQRSLLSSAVFFGFFTGSFISGYITNKFGRKWPTISSTFVIWIFTTCTPHTTNFMQVFTFRILVGIAIGVAVPGSTTIVTESIPSIFRSFTLNILWILYPLGIIYICFISMFFIKDEEDLEWRKIWFVNSFTSISMIFMSFALKESPRYLIHKGNYEEAFTILNQMGQGSAVMLSEEEKGKIIEEAKLKEEETKNEPKSDFNIRSFLEKKYFFVSLLLAYLWFVSSFISYGLLYILPKIFDSISKNDKVDSLKHMIHAMFILFPCPLFRGLISEWKFLGRKNAMIVGFAGSMLAGFFCIINTSHLSLSSGMLKFFINTSLGILSVYTSEVYPTSLRSIALGFGNSITRMGGIVTPFICEFVHSFFFPSAPFYVFVIAAVTGVFACISLPFETMGKALDSLEDESKNSKIIECKKIEEENDILLVSKGFNSKLK